MAEYAVGRCQWCGTLLPLLRLRRQRYCSKTHWNRDHTLRSRQQRHKVPPPLRHCPWCQEIIPPDAHRSQVYCPGHADSAAHARKRGYRKIYERGANRYSVRMGCACRSWRKCSRHKELA